MDRSTETLVGVWKRVCATNFDGYGAQPIPSPLDDMIEALVREFIALAPAERKVVATLAPLPPFAMFAFSERMATAAVRHDLLGDLLAGLIALVLEGFRYDARENLPILALHHDAALRLRVDPAPVFAEAASYATPDAARWIIGFLDREPAHVSLAEMGYRVMGEGSEFRYERTW